MVARAKVQGSDEQRSNFRCDNKLQNKTNPVALESTFPERSNVLLCNSPLARMRFKCTAFLCGPAKLRGSGKLYQRVKPFPHFRAHRRSRQKSGRPFTRNVARCANMYVRCANKSDSSDEHVFISCTSSGRRRCRNGFPLCYALRREGAKTLLPPVPGSSGLTIVGNSLVDESELCRIN